MSVFICCFSLYALALLSTPLEAETKPFPCIQAAQYYYGRIMGRQGGVVVVVVAGWWAAAAESSKEAAVVGGLVCCRLAEPGDKRLRPGWPL